MNNQEINTDISISSIQKDKSMIDLTTDEIESQVRKRLSEDVNSSYIWSNFQLYEKDNENNEWNLSDIWCLPHPGEKRMAHREKYKQLIVKNVEMVLKCKHCGETFQYYKNGSSPSAKQHMENNHPELLSMKTPPSKRPYGSVTKADDFTKRANVLLASLIVTSKESYNFVSNDYLQLFVNHIQSSDIKYIVPNRDSFSQKIIPEMANNVIKQIK